MEWLYETDKRLDLVLERVVPTRVPAARSLGVGNRYSWMKWMDIQGLFAVICVSDLDQSVDSYSRLVGREPDDRPMDWLVQWRDLSGAGLQLVLDRERAGDSHATIVTPDLANARKKLAAVSIEPETESGGDFGSVATINDPDGNQIWLVEPPAPS